MFRSLSCNPLGTFAGSRRSGISGVFSLTCQHLPRCRFIE